MERKESLQFEHYSIYQDESLGCFSEDSIALSSFAELRSDWRVLDLGTGNGILAILGEAKHHCAFTGIDINPAQLELARKSAFENHQQIDFVHLDYRDAPAFFGHGSFNAIVCNPPYFHNGDISQNRSLALARHQSQDDFNLLLQSAFLLLKNGGMLYICYPSRDLCSLLCLLRENRLEPKTLCFPRDSLVLAACKKLGKAGLRISNL
ncbi:MAG: methyltransferase domain-containing protein [Clostridia bacterium]|nr:methyltransferase domain-containing protein [Clostridia bacterium]